MFGQVLYLGPKYLYEKCVQVVLGFQCWSDPITLHCKLYYFEKVP